MLSDLPPLKGLGGELVVQGLAKCVSIWSPPIEANPEHVVTSLALVAGSCADRRLQDAAAVFGPTAPGKVSHLSSMLLSAEKLTPQPSGVPASSRSSICENVSCTLSRNTLSYSGVHTRPAHLNVSNSSKKVSNPSNTSVGSALESARPPMT